MAVFRFFFLTALALGAFAHTLPAQIDIGIAQRDADKDRVPIAVVSSNTQVQQLARRAFGVHGHYTVVADAANAAHQIRIEPQSASVNLTISGRTGSGRGQFSVSGSDLRNAVLRACDKAVEETSGLPGFFAGRLAFVGKQRGFTEIYVSDLFFSSVRKLTDDRALVIGPRWSPDGSKLLYTSYFKSGFPDIFEIDLKTRQRTAFAGFKGTNTGATYSPDGSRVAMSLSGNGNAEIYISDRNGRNLKRMTNNKSLEASPSWSPDGSRIVFTSDSPGRPRLFEMSSRGGPMRALPTNISSYCSEPNWNPVDPNLIAFSAAVGSGFQIAVFDMRSRSSKWISNVQGDALEPSWLRDGRHLVFTQRSGGKKRLMILDSKTGKARALHSPAFGDASHASFVY